MLRPIPPGAPAVDVTGAVIPLVRKTSELFLQYAQPLIEGISDVAELRAALNMALVGWNMALLPPKDREAAMNRAFSRKGESPEELALMRQMISTLIERKLTDFGDVDREIRDVAVVPGPGRRYEVRVLAALSEEEVEKPHPELPPEEEAVL